MNFDQIGGDDEGGGVVDRGFDKRDEVKPEGQSELEVGW
jgi:hypothetical protein